MNGPIRRLALGLFVCLIVLLGAVTWIQAVAADTYRNDPRNTRAAIAQAGKERGVIVASDGTTLAESVPDTEDPRRFTRVYPEGEAFAHVIGYTSQVVGDAGLERAFVDQLRSRRDLTFSDLISAILGRDLRPQSIRLTLDAELQRAAYELLGDRSGAVVALDPRTGAVLAMVSTPSFDPHLLDTAEAAANWETLLDDPERPLADRATRELYPPGSTFKTIVTAAALDVGIADPETTFDDPPVFELPGSTATISNFGGGLCGDGTTVTLLRGFVRSCNTVFADLSIQVGAQDIGIVAEGLGFNQELEFPWQVAESAFPTETLADDDAALAQSGLGERDVRATPLQMAMVAAAIANQGTVMQPYLMDQLFDADGNAVEVTEPEALGEAMGPETASVLAQMMERVVTEGTGTAATVPGVRVAGKTGTASAPEGASYPWFIGFAPMEDPTIALAVMFEPQAETGESDTGGRVAAPVAGDLIAQWLESRG
ncbi:MAG TPA: penicillin-binding transpeptidase domain-containing protein [Acidimicrobiia bacterium]|nr:penicillin-binding transpeptidase domain-containing protein [Acidimicrobiia bacterium]